MKTFILLFFLTLLSSSFVISQGSLEERKLLADEYFDKGLYTEAQKLYQVVLANKPRDHEINYKYGVCLLMTGGEKGLEDSKKYLDYAGKGEIDDFRLDFFKGYWHELKGECETALEFYRKCLSSLKGKEKKTLGLKARIKHCENLLSN